eukprot:4017245-Pleurochrysis_carterae.AAC.1
MTTDYGDGPQLYYPPPGEAASEESSERSRRGYQMLADEGVIDLDDRTRTYKPGARHRFPTYKPPKKTPDVRKPRPVFVTERDEIDPAVKQALCGMFAWTEPAPIHDGVEPVVFPGVSHTIPDATYGPEDVSNLTGMAVLYAPELHLKGKLVDVTSMLQ